MSVRENFSELAQRTAALRNVVQSFPASNFEPSILYRNEHWQTIVGSGALKSKYLGPPRRSFEVVRERIETLDGDFFDVEYTKCFDDPRTDRVVLLLHGLESNTEGPQITNFATAFLKKGFGCCLVSFRGCSGEDNRTPGAYHLGFTKDVDYLVSQINQRYPDKKIYLSGFSLGGNVILKYLGELGDTAEERGVHGAAVTCVPFDPTKCQSKLDVGFNRRVYSMNFLQTLKKKAELEHQKLPGYFDIEEIRASDTIGAFDDAYIAKIYGFRDKFHYYRSCGAKWWLNKIRVPAVAINARDDPFIEVTSLPTEAEDVGEIAPVRLIYHDHGGHCGFFTRQPTMLGLSSSYSNIDNPSSAAGTADGATKIMVNDDKEYTEIPIPAHGWLAEELSRAIHHIHHA
eukprot:CAMPEP_0174963448 /NCGR_PEP_ID=MMETSP0004_2-20121128/5336_1 /TAXON_ID=420556 /ORGANISM="Ochromonas sp., Strain CCMP1393" /LENGTH=400 /DNA_ID=CAMNT_0016212075 /DNA_START=151 /DNA_END=1353 /DNA_ORIENTATION=-